MTNWNMHEPATNAPKDPYATPLQRTFEKPRRVVLCEVCRVEMGPDEIAYSGPRWCVDCHADIAEREAKNG